MAMEMIVAPTTLNPPMPPLDAGGDRRVGRGRSVDGS